MTAAAEPPRADVAMLADELLAAANRASEVQTAQNLAVDFGTRTTRLKEAAATIENLNAVLASPLLELDPEVAAANSECRATLSALLDKVREVVANNPDGLRRGNLWRQVDAAISKVPITYIEAIERAFRRLVDKRPSPEVGLLAAVPPGTTGTEPYRAAVAEYEEASRRVPRTLDALDEFVTLTASLNKLQEQLLPQAVPTEHRVQWRELMSGQLRLGRLDDDFRGWLEDRGMLDGVVVLYRPA